MKWGYKLRGPDYGTRTDYMVCRAFEDAYEVGCPVFPDSQWPFFKKYPGPKLSTGIRAVLIVCELLKPRSIVLAAFDAVKEGNNKAFLNAFGRTYDPPLHDFAREKELIPVISKDYGLPITYL